LKSREKRRGRSIEGEGQEEDSTIPEEKKEKTSIVSEKSSVEKGKKRRGARDCVRLLERKGGGVPSLEKKKEGGENIRSRWDQWKEFTDSTGGRGGGINNERRNKEEESIPW